MKALVDSFLCAFLLFSAVPAPRSAWNRGGIRYALCFLPLAGLLKTVALLGWVELCVRFDLSAGLFAAVAVLLPLLLTRSAHLAGLVLVADAQASRAPLRKKLLASADEKPGVYGMLAAAGYMLLQYGLFFQIYTSAPGALLLPALGYVASAALGAVSFIMIRPAKSSGLGYTLHGGSQRHAVLIAGAGAYLIAIFFCLGVSFLWGFAAAGACVALLFLHRAFCLRAFGGGSGSLAGVLILGVELAFLLIAALAAL